MSKTPKYDARVQYGEYLPLMADNEMYPCTRYAVYAAKEAMFVTDAQRR